MGAADVLSQFFAWGIDPGLLLYGQYNPWLVLLSVCVAAFSSTMGLQAAYRAQRVAQTGLRRWTLLAGSLALGCGVWAMHFIGMLSFELCAAVDLSPGITLLSVLPSLGASWVALGLLSQTRVTFRELLMGGVLVGSGIGAMHYVGMTAMTMAPLLRYDPLMFSLSILVAVALAVLALWVRFGLASLFPGRSELVQTGLSGGVMGLAIAGMHYTGMAAARFIGQPETPHPTSIHDAVPMALVITLVTLVATALVASASAMARYRELAQQLQGKETRLRASEAQFRTLIRNIPGISYRCRLGSGWPMVFISDAVEHLTGYAPNQFLGARPAIRFADLVPPADVLRVTEIVRSSLQESRPFVLEFQLRHRDGTMRWMWGNGSAVLNAEGVVEWVDGVLLDITERRQMEEALRQAKVKAEDAAMARSTFLANMSHEIRTPMNAIIGFTEVVLGGQLAPEQRRHLDTVHRSARSLLYLLNDILDSSKLERGALHLERLPFSVGDLVAQLCAEQSIQAGHKQLLLRSQVAPSVGACVEGDPHRLRQILLNLLGNALKFTEQGEVEISAHREGETVHFAVRDTGIGIAPERLPHIFDPFTQADASMSRRYGGTGLGTTISKQLTELMHGRIWVDSTLGQGSTFHVVVPLPVSEQRPVPGNQATPTLHSLPPLRILVADDVAQNTELLGVVLGRLGHDVHAVGNGEEALAFLHAHPVDVVLMDVQMPLMDGLTATRAIRALQGSQADKARVPIIGLSASVQQADRQAALAAGMNGFATKPVEVAALTAEIARVTGQPSASTPQMAPTSPAVAQSEHDTSLVDIERGMRVWGDRKAYLKSLARFAQDQAWCLNNPERQALPTDPEQVRLEAHRLHGVAANLGLSRVEQAAHLVERHAASGQTEGLHDSWAQLILSLQLTLAEVTAWNAELGQDDAVLATMSPAWDAALSAHCDSLARRLLSGFQRSERPEPAFTDFCDAVRPFVTPAHLDRLESAVDEFDFDAAAALLQQLTQGLPSTETPHAPV